MNQRQVDQIIDMIEKEGIKLSDVQARFLEDNFVTNEQEFNEFKQWFIRKQTECEAEVKQINLKDVWGDWFIDKDTGDIAHISGGFFRLIGVDIVSSQRESGKGWKQPMMDQGTESSIAGLLKQRQNDKNMYLVEAKFEPGNYGKVLISPALQVTFSNLNQAHKGKKPLLAEFFDQSNPQFNILYDHWLPEDGGRFYLKRVKYMVVEIPEDFNVNVNDNFRWVSINTLKQMMQFDNYVNPHVRTLLAIL
jgi:dTDP-4-dehydro-6-deoxy-alpha-D-glucopyranose 2,3-dehydratase